MNYRCVFSQAKRAKGFTLLEVLIALAVVAVALAALITASGRQLFMANTLRDTTIAQWVAANQITLMHLEQIESATAKSNTSVVMLNQTWYVTRLISATEQAGINRVEIQIRKRFADESPMYSLAGLIAEN